MFGALAANAPADAIAQRAPSRPNTTRAGGQDAPPLADLIAAALGGGSDASVDAALDALRERADERSVDALISLARHRRAGARRRAYLALATLRAGVARDAVARGLSDVDPGVRSVAARALGDMGAQEALPQLFVALERGVHDAARSIGALARSGDLPRFHAQLGAAPLPAMLEGYARLVRRADLSWGDKQDILHRLFEVSGLLVRAFLVQWHHDLPAAAPAELRGDLERSIRRIPLRPRARAATPAPTPATTGAAP
jgi:hypothetical protein